MFFCYWGGYKSQWSTMRDFNWEHSNSYIYNAQTHWPILPYNPFCQIQYFSKFYSALSCKYWEIHPNKIFQWSNGIVSCPIKYGGKLFMADEGQNVLGRFIQGLLYMEGWWLHQLPIMKGYTLEDKPLTSQQNCRSIYSWS